MTKTFNERPPRLQTYWLGERTHTPVGNAAIRLDEIPEMYAVVYLAFALVLEENRITLDFLCQHPNTQETVRAGIKKLQDRSTLVILSVGGWGGNSWQSVCDEAVLCSAICQTVEDWNLDGVCLDYMGDRNMPPYYVAPPSAKGGVDLSELTRLLRSGLPECKKLIASIHAEQDFVQRNWNSLSWVMAIDYKTTPSLFDDLASYCEKQQTPLPFLPVVIGITLQDPQMSLEQVYNLCDHAAIRGSCSAVFWVANEDHPDFTGKPVQAYAEVMHKALGVASDR
jgi:hypothetical protein